jgi:endo-1,4-beta-xylanase
MIILLLYCLFSVIVWAQNPIGLRASSYLRGIPFGAAVQVDKLRTNVDNGQYNQKLKDNYQLLVPENELKPQRLWWGENKYNWYDADFLLGATANSTGWAQQNLMQVRGHVLVWGIDKYTPKWLLDQELTITSDKAKQLLNDYIHAVVGRYRGKIPWWDVVNEAIDDNNNTNSFNLRNGFWYRKLGPDFLKYAFIFAHATDPTAQLYYNEYSIESVGLKATRTINLINWLRSQGAVVHGIGLQWHRYIPTFITPGDGHYQITKKFIDNNLDIMITEFDVSLQTIGDQVIDPVDLRRQAFVYRSLLELAVYFSPNCKAMLTWGFTDRYSWIPTVYNNTRGAGLPLDKQYQPKPAYLQMQEVLTRVVVGGIYRLSPQSQPDKCLGTSQNTTSSDVQLYSGPCNDAYQKWNITWLGDGTYRFSSQNINNRVLIAYNTTASVGGVQTSNWSGDLNQGWAFSERGNNTFRVVPRTAWWRVMTVYGASNNIGVIDRNDNNPQNWILSKI